MAKTLTTTALSHLEKPARELIQRAMREMRIEAGQHVFSPGNSCSNYLIVKRGSVRVSVTTETGREILLYHVRDGETCVLTTACLMSGQEYNAEAIADTDTEAVILPKAVFDELIGSSPLFRQYVFASYGTRLQSLIGLVQEISVKHVDRRLARLLVARAESGAVEMTHNALAVELNTAREVVTRLLHDFAERGWVQLERGQVSLCDQVALEKLSTQM
jgi:CRP/FNR family transcriptional regulator, anaerobic regulatory protein